MTTTPEPTTPEPTTSQPAAPEPTAPGPPRGRRLRSIVLLVLAVAGLGVVAGLTVVVAQADHGAAKTTGPHQPAAALPFSLPALSGSGRISLAAYAGRPVIVNFFASWCGPCQHETPLLAGFYAAHHGHIMIIGVDSNDQNAAALTFTRAEHVGYPVGVDAFPAHAATSYGVLGLPQTFFLNAQHKIVLHIEGAVTARELDAWAAQVG